MKRLVFLCFLLVLPLSASSQLLFLEYMNEEGKVDYCLGNVKKRDLDNSVRFVAKKNFYDAEEIPIKEYSVSLLTDAMCLPPSYKGEGDSISAFIRNNLKRLKESQSFYVRAIAKDPLVRIPSAAFSVAKYTVSPHEVYQRAFVKLAGGGTVGGASISKDSLSLFKEVCFIDNEMNMVVKAFSLLCFSNSGNCVKYRSRSSSFSDEMLNFLKKISKGQKFYITDISIEGTNSKTNHKTIEVIVN